MVKSPKKTPRMLYASLANWYKFYFNQSTEFKNEFFSYCYEQSTREKDPTVLITNITTLMKSIQMEGDKKKVDKEKKELDDQLEKSINKSVFLQKLMPKKVFISYNHNDKEAARHLKNALEKTGIQVTIDSEAMPAGSKIADFIHKSIQDTDVTVSIVSEKSLLSAWVAMESILTLHNQKQFIGCYITDKFFENEFVNSSEDEIDQRIEKLNAEIKERLDKGRGIEYLTDELSRQKDLKHNLSKFINELRSRLCIDIAGYKFIDNVPKVIEAILSAN